MTLTRLAEDPWAEPHDIPVFIPPPIPVKSCHVPLTAERAEEVVKTHIERQITAQLGESANAPRGHGLHSAASRARQQPGAQGALEGFSDGEDEEIVEDDGSGLASPRDARKLLDADLLDAWMRGAGMAPEEDSAPAGMFGGPRNDTSRGRPASSLGPLSRRLSCPEGLLQDDAGGARDPMQQDALEPLANHHAWMFNRGRWAEADGGAGLLYSASSALQVQHRQHHPAAYLMGGGGEGWQPRDAASFLATNASAGGQERGDRLSRLAAEGGSPEALRTLAAVIIQAYCRGWRARRQVARMRSALRCEEARRKELAAAEALARERGVVRRQLRAAARDCLLAVQAQQDYERTRARLAAARGMGPGAAAAPPPEPPIIPPALWARCKALGQDPIQVLLDGGMMSHQIEAIIAASALASQLPRRVAARTSIHSRRSGGGGGGAGGEVAGGSGGGGRSSGGGGSVEEKSVSVSEDGGGAAAAAAAGVPRGGGVLEGMDPAVPPVAAASRLSLPGRGSPLVPRTSAKQLQSLMVGPSQQMNTAQLVAQMLANQQPAQQQPPQLPPQGLGPGAKRQGSGTGSGMMPQQQASPQAAGGQRSVQSPAAGGARVTQLSPLPLGARGQVAYGQAVHGRNVARRMSDYIGSAGAIPAVLMASSLTSSSPSTLSLAAIGSSAVASAQPDGRAPPMRARSMGQEAGAAAAAAALGPVPPPHSLSPVRVVLPTLMESSDKGGPGGGGGGGGGGGSGGGAGGSPAALAPAAIREVTSRGSGGLQQQQQQQQHLVAHHIAHAALTTASSSPIARMAHQSSLGAFSDGSPTVRRRHSYVGSPGGPGSLPPTGPAAGGAGGSGSSGGAPPADGAVGAPGYAAGAAAAAALSRLHSRGGGHRSFTHASVAPQPGSGGVLPALLPTQGSWSALHGSGSGSAASSGNASPVLLSGPGGQTAPATADMPFARLRRGSNLAPATFSTAFAMSGVQSPQPPPHPPGQVAPALSSPMTIRRLQSLNSSNTAAAAAAAVGAAAAAAGLSSSPTASGSNVLTGAGTAGGALVGGDGGVATGSFGPDGGAAAVHRRARQSDAAGQFVKGRI